MTAPKMPRIGVRSLHAHPRGFLALRPVAHVLAWGSELSDGEPAYCGVQPEPGRGWMGAGNTIERDMLTELPLCFDCERARRNGLRPPSTDSEELL